MQTSERLSVVAIITCLVDVLFEIYVFAANFPRSFYIYIAILMLASAAAFSVVAMLETIRKMGGTGRSGAFWILSFAWLACAVTMFAIAFSA